jgi:hypothetical protein
MSKFAVPAGFLHDAVRAMVPQIARIEDDIKEAKSGPRKKAAVLDAVLQGLSLTKEYTGKDVLGHPKTLQVLGDINDALVAAHNGLGAVLATSFVPATAAELGAPAGSIGE